MINLTPVITEKSYNAIKAQKFTFLTPLGVGKKEVGKEVEKRFGVNVIGVESQTVTYRNADRKKRKTVLHKHKKFILTLKKGQSIKDFAPVTEEKDKKSEKVNENDKK